MTEKSFRYPLSFSPHDLSKGLFIEMNFSKVLPNLKIAFSIAFNLVSKFASCPATGAELIDRAGFIEYIARAGFILIIPDAEEIAVVVIVEGEL